MRSYQMILIYLLPIAGVMAVIRMKIISKRWVQPENDSDAGEDRDYIHIVDHRTHSDRTAGVDSETAFRVKKILSFKTKKPTLLHTQSVLS